MMPDKSIFKKFLTEAMALTILIFAGTAVFAQISGQSFGDTLRIEDVIRNTIQNNDQVGAAKSMEEAAQAKIGPAGAWDDPMLMFGVQNVPTNFNFQMDPMTMKMIGISQNIPYAGQKSLQAKAARVDALSAREDWRNTQVDLATAAKVAYFDLYYKQLALEYIGDQHQLQEQVVNTTSARLRTDQASQADMAAAQADLWRIESDLSSSAQDVEASRNNLLSLMGKESGTILPTLSESPMPEIPDSPNVWIERAQKNYSPLLKLRWQGESYAYSAAAMRRMRWPMLNLQASYGIRQSTEMEKRDNMISFQANISLPIFQGRQQGNAARSMEAMRRGSDLEASQMQRNIEADINTLHSRALQLSKSLKIYSEQIIPADQDALTSALAGYSANRVPFANLLAYANAIYRDRLGANQIAFELSRTLAEAQKYTLDPDALGKLEKY